MADVSEHRRNLAFKAGQKARREGKPETANNRQPGTIYFDDWADGWGDPQRGVYASNDKDGGERG